MGKAYTVSDVLTIVRSSYLNDPNSGIYTDAKILPDLKLAYLSLQTELQKHNIICGNAKSEGIRIPVGQKIIPPPGDFFMPINIQERNWGSSDKYTDLTYRRWSPDRSLSYQLEYYDFNGETINTPGANVEKEVVIYYQKDFPTIQAVTDYVLSKAEQYLASKTAAIIHMFKSQNPQLASVCNDEAKNNLDQILVTYIKKTQATPAKRKGYVPPYRY